MRWKDTLTIIKQRFSTEIVSDGLKVVLFFSDDIARMRNGND